MSVGLDRPPRQLERDKQAVEKASAAISMSFKSRSHRGVVSNTANGQNHSHSIVRMHHNVLILHDKLFFTCPVYRQLDRQKLTLLISLKNFG